MYSKLKRSKRTLWGQQGKVCDSCEKLGRETTDNLGNNKRDFRADVLSLLSSALRPRLLGVLRPSLIVAGLIFVSFINPIPVFATSLTLDMPSGIILDIAPSKGESFKKSDTSRILVKTDASFGYSLNIKAEAGNDLINNGSRIVSINDKISEEEFKSTANYNTWGFLPSKLDSKENTDYLAGPSVSPVLLEKTTAANDKDNYYDISIAAKVDNILDSGQYSNVFTVSAVVNTTNYTFNYELNAGYGGPSSPQIGSTTEKTVLIDNKIPSKENYEFLGWCDESTEDDSCPGHTYAAGAEYPYSGSLDAFENNVTLYAIWKPTGFEESFKKFGKQVDSASGYYKMQDMTSEICNLINAPDTNSTTTLIDIRDSSTYTVAKLKDDRCWMTQNLKIGNNSSSTILSYDLSDSTSNFNLPSGRISGFSSGAYNSSFVYIDQNNGFYSWFAATSGSTISSGDAPYSICPKGWKLPTSAEFLNLGSAYSNNKGGSMLKNPLNFTLTGEIYNSSLTSSGSIGIFWSSSAQSRGIAIRTNIHATAYYPSVESDKGAGHTIRCVAR